MTLRRHAATAALFAALAIIHLWPLATAPATVWRSNADTRLNAWALAWVVHQAPRDPLHLFDGNIFYPEPRTLAFSEHLIPQAVLAAPVLLAGGSAVLTYNLVLMAGFALTGWAMAWAVTRWTGHWGAGIVAGVALAFNAHHMSRLAHLQALHVYYLPLAFVALDELCRRGRWKDAFVTAGAAMLQALTSGYWLVFTIAALGAAMIVRARELWTAPVEAARERLRPILRLVVGAACAGLVMVPFLYPYWLARQRQGLVRSIGEVTHFSATWLDYLSSTGRLHSATVLRRFYLAPPPHDVLFPGVTILALVLVAVVTRVAWQDPRARMLVAVALAGIVLSLGPAFPPYRWLYEHVALLQGIRAPSRFGILALFAAAGLAGFGLARADDWIRSRRGPVAAAALTAVAFVLVNVEAARAPFEYRQEPQPSAVYRVLAKLPDATAVAEFPMYSGNAIFRNAEYMLASTVHWKPIVNGYSGFRPASYRRLAGLLRHFPEPPTTDILRGMKVTHVIVHFDRFGSDRDRLLDAMQASGDFALVAGDDDTRLYRLEPR
jgi:hypothetical protein